MSSIVCPSCQSETPSEYNFCTSCDKQTRCLNNDCNKPLIAGKTFCFGCGQSIVALNNTNQPNRFIRKVSQRGDDYDEYTEVTASDHAVSELAPYVGGQMPLRPVQKRINTVQNQDNNSNAGNSHSQQFAEIEQHQQSQLPPAVDEPQQEVNTTADTKTQTTKYFVKDGETLVLTHKDFKGKKWAEQQRRFILLFVDAYIRCFGKPLPSKDLIDSVAKKAKVFDSSNFTRYVGQICSKEITEISSGLTITTDGEKELKKIIEEIENDSIPEGFPYWERTANSTRKRESLSNDDKNRIAGWAKEEVNLGNFDIRNIKDSIEYGMLALWIITVSLKKEQTVRRIEAYNYLKSKFPTVTVSPEAFSSALKSKSNQKYIQASDDDKYYLSVEGQKKVESWISNSSTSQS